MLAVSGAGAAWDPGVGWGNELCGRAGHDRVRGPVVPPLQAGEEVPRRPPGPLRQRRHRRRSPGHRAAQGAAGRRADHPHRRLRRRDPRGEPERRGAGPPHRPHPRGRPVRLRPGHRRGRASRAGGRHLRRPRGHRRHRRRRQRPRRPGRDQRPDRQLPGVPRRHLRRRAGRAVRGPGPPVRGGAPFGGVGHRRRARTATTW